MLKLRVSVDFAVAMQFPACIVSTIILVSYNFSCSNREKVTHLIDQASACELSHRTHNYIPSNSNIRSQPVIPR